MKTEVEVEVTVASLDGVPITLNPFGTENSHNSIEFRPF